METNKVSIGNYIDSHASPCVLPLIDQTFITPYLILVPM